MEPETNEKLDDMILDYTKEVAAMDDEAIHETIPISPLIFLH
ncbi:hypothetical protein ACQKGI_02590 [Peribacillus muralis]